MCHFLSIVSFFIEKCVIFVDCVIISTECVIVSRNIKLCHFDTKCVSLAAQSSAAAERRFSVLSNIKTKLRNSLLLDTKDSLMHAKQLVSRTSGTVRDWDIPPDMRKNFMAWYREKEEKTNDP